MKKLMFYGPKDVRWDESEIPKPASGEVLVKNKVTLTCGTDVKIYNRGYAIFDPPFALGHEASGVVESIGEGVTKFKVGDRVVAHNTAPCNKCYFCKKGQHSMCDDLLLNNADNGAYAEYQLIPKRIVEQNMFKIPDDMTYKQAALTEPFACAVYGIDQVPIEQGDYVVVNGCGPIGLMFIRLSYLKGARVIACDKNENRLNMAKKMGAYDIINIDEVENQVEAVKTLTPDGRGADVVIEAVGLAEVWELAVNMARKGGTVLWFGGTKSGAEVKLDTKRMHYEQINIKGVFHTTPKAVNAAFELLKMKAIDEKDFVDNEYRLDDVEKALIEHGTGSVIKNCIIY